MMKKLSIIIVLFFTIICHEAVNAQGVDSQANKQLVSMALEALFVQKDTAAIGKYFAEDYIQHNPLFPSGRNVLYGLVANMPPHFKFEPGLMIGEGEFVVVHSRYSGLMPTPLIVVDVFRVKNGMITEHWDVGQEEVPAEKTVGKNPMFPIK